MKKYKSLMGFILVAGLMLSFAAVVKAEENEVNDDGILPPPILKLKERDGLRESPTKGTLRESPTLLKAEEKIESFKENKEEFKNQREEFKKAMETKREAFKKEAEARRKEFMDAQKIGREAFMTELKAKREEFKNANKEKREEFRNNAKRMIGERFEAAVKNLEGFQARVASVIENLNTDGKDTTTATEYLKLSKEKLEAGKIKIAEIKALLPGDGTEVTPEIFEKVKILAREAKDLLKESKNNLQESLKALKTLKDDSSSDDSAGGTTQ